MQSTDYQLSAVMRAAGALQLGDRASFLQAIASALQDEPSVGDGSLHRLCMSVQREFLRARPVLDDQASSRAQSRYSRASAFTRRHRAGSRAAAPR